MWIASASCPAFWDSPPSRYTTRTVLRPVQAHVQAGGGACLAGSRLDKVTDLVDEPEAVTARHLLRGGAVPGERISDVPGVSYLADELLAGSPNLHRSAATGVAQGIAGELADGDHQVGNAWQREPGPLGLGGDKAANLAQVVAVTQRLGVRWRERQRPITSRRNLRRAQVCGACCLLPVPDDGRVGACRIGNDRLRKRGAVIGAQKSNGAVPESQVDQRLVPGCFLYLGGRAAGPDRSRSDRPAPGSAE